MKLVRACVVMLLAASAAPAVMADGDERGCLVALEEGAALRDLHEGPRAVAPVGGEQSARVLFACRAGRVSGVTIRLLPGQAAEAGLLLADESGNVAELSSEDGLPSEWSRVDARRLDSGTVIVTLRVVAPDSAQAGRVYSDRLSLGPARARLAVPVTLEIVDDQPLFRDQFNDVDPVIGQFSMTDEAQQEPFRRVFELPAD